MAERGADSAAMGGRRGKVPGPGLKALWYGSPLYRLALAGKTPQSFMAVPPDPWPGEGTRGNAMLAGEYQAAGRTRRIDEHPWRQSDAPMPWLAELHGFCWLRDVREVGGEEPARFAAAMVDGWIERHQRWSALPWRADVLADRLINWIANSAMIFRGADRTFIDRFFRSLAMQRRHLMRLVPGELAGSALLHAVKGLIYAHLALAERAAPLAASLALLSKELEKQVLPDGGHVERSPWVHIGVLRDLVDIRGALLAAHKEVPAGVQSAIDRMAPTLRFFRHGDGGLALFNGSKEENGPLIDLVLTQAGRGGRGPSALNDGGFQRMQAGRSVLIVDCGAPPPPGVDRYAHAGTLSMELSIGRERLIVNCGAFPAGPAEWRDAARATAAHSTLVIADVSSSELKPDGLGRRPVVVEAQRQEANGAHWLEAHHDGWQKPFGAVHRRRLYLAESGEDIRGEDVVEAPASQPSTLRFHLHPDVQASLQQDGEAVLLRLRSGGGWRLRADGARMTLEESVYLGGPEPRRTEQVVLTGHVDGPQQVKWAISKVG
jgi:uncharacterized heparinase superfamily protein